MLTPEQALEAVLARVSAPSPERAETVPLSAAAGRCLAAPVGSDVDVPPFEKSMMDGYAVRSSDFAGVGSEHGLRCVGESRAGAPFAGSVPAGACIEIYTGAELPPDCDAVEQVERTRRAPDGEQVLFEGPVAAGRHVSHRGEIMGSGRIVLEPPRRLTAADLAVLASGGCDPVPVFRRLTVSVLTTGDELVPAAETPGRGQIREGNTLFLSAACERLGCTVRRAGIVPDDPDELESAFRSALEEGDVLITTGGVSVGKYDLVAAAFERIGVEPVLHKVAIKPGKPIWFGLLDEKPVFGLPGNPVASLLGFEVFVRPALGRLAGAGPVEASERLRRGRWRGRTTRASGRQHNLPARICPGTDGVDELEPVPFRGSSDVVGASLADALVVVPADTEITTDALVTYRPLVW